jgi:hypothetical protein
MWVTRIMGPQALGVAADLSTSEELSCDDHK